jgi:hypothetical protein
MHERLQPFMSGTPHLRSAASVKAANLRAGNRRAPAAFAR